MCDSRDVDNAHKFVPQHLLPNQCSRRSDTNSENQQNIEYLDDSIIQLKGQLFKVIRNSGLLNKMLEDYERLDS